MTKIKTSKQLAMRSLNSCFPELNLATWIIKISTIKKAELRLKSSEISIKLKLVSKDCRLCRKKNQVRVYIHL